MLTDSRQLLCGALIPFADASRGSRADSVAGQHVALIGHCDTVFPEGTAAQRTFRVDGDLAYRPGVAYRQDGLVDNSFVLAAFARAGVQVRLVGRCTADKEIASPVLRAFINAHAVQARAVSNSEPGRPSGNVVTGRKGIMFVDREVKGIPAHSGVNHHRDGAIAIWALGRNVQPMHRLTDYESGTTVNLV